MEEAIWSQFFTGGINYDPAFRIVNRTYDRIVAALRLPTRQQRHVELAKLRAELPWFPEDSYGDQVKAWMTRSQRGELIGRLMMGDVLSSIPQCTDARDRAEQAERNHDIAFALAAYRADHQRYPKTLDELAPKYMSEVPGDLFTGKALIYLPNETGYLLSSVGVDAADVRDDVNVEMPLRPPEKQKQKPVGPKIDDF